MSNLSPNPAPRDEPKQALRRELMAILLVYATLTVLPLLTGFACSG